MGDEEGANELGGIDGYRVGSDEGSSDVDGMRLGSTEGISDFDGPEDIDGTGLGLAERAGLGRAEGADVMLGKAEGLSDIVGAGLGRAEGAPKLPSSKAPEVSSSASSARTAPVLRRGS